MTIEIHQERIKNQNRLNYNSLLARLKSRFELSTGMYFNCMAILVSSPGEATSFCQELVDKASSDPNIYLVQAPQWEVLKSKRTYSKESFKIYIGSDNSDAYIIENSEDEKYIIDKNESHLILDVPMDYYQNFKDDIHVAIKDIAGITSRSNFSFISSNEMINKVFNKNQKSLFRTNLLKIKFDDSSRIIDYVDRDVLKYHIKLQKKCYIHIDIGVTGDYTGISMVYIDHFRKIKRKNIITNTTNITDDPVYKVVFCTYIKKFNQSDEVPIFKIRDFIIDLKKSGIYLGRVSCDGFQSTSLLQELKYNNINTKLISLDRTMNGYNTLKLAIKDERIKCHENDYLKKELQNLQLVKRGNSYKVDHPSEFRDGTKGRKDASDSLSGAIYSAFLDRDSLSMTLDSFSEDYEDYEENDKIEIKSEDILSNKSDTEIDKDLNSIVNKQLEESGSDFRLVDDEDIWY